MNSIIDKGERLLPAMFSGGMHCIRLATSNGELWGAHWRDQRSVRPPQSRER